jgi:hypothetical protein
MNEENFVESFEHESERKISKRDADEGRNSGFR